MIAGADLRKRLLEVSQDAETVEDVIQAILGGMKDSKGAAKTGDAIKVFELLCRIQAEDAGEEQAVDLPEDADLSQFPDAQLLTMEAALARELGDSLPAALRPESPSVRDPPVRDPPHREAAVDTRRTAESRETANIQLRLEDYL